MASSSLVVFVLAVFTLASANIQSATFPENVIGSGLRIVSGWEAAPGQIPHQISLRMVNPIGTVSSCGGSVIHNYWGISAAHCTAGRPTIVIRAGLVHLTQPQYFFETTTWFNHPLYNNNLPQVVQPHDIALLNFERFLPFSDYIQPIRLQSSEDMNRNYQGQILTASGWGRTWTNGPLPEHLNWVYLRGVSHFDCLLAFGFSSIIVDSTICASSYNVTSQSTCSGDSGGPLSVVEDDGLLSLVGVASFVSGTGCHTDVPAGFIRPGHYHDWYTEVTGLNFDPSRPDNLTTTTEEPQTTQWTTTEGPIATNATEGPQTTDYPWPTQTEGPIVTNGTEGPQTTDYPWPTQTDGPIVTNGTEGPQTTDYPWPTQTDGPIVTNGTEGPQTTDYPWPTQTDGPIVTNGTEGPQTTDYPWPTRTDGPIATNGTEGPQTTDYPWPTATDGPIATNGTEGPQTTDYPWPTATDGPIATNGTEGPQTTDYPWPTSADEDNHEVYNDRRM